MSRPKPLTREQIEVLPTLNEAVYEPPAGLGAKIESKACSNCALWSLDKRCGIHAPDRIVFAWDGCSYHVSGFPTKRRLPIQMKPPLDPKLSGLNPYPGGTSCGQCAFFAPDAKGPLGDCYRIRQDNVIAYARVHRMGCSSRFVSATATFV